MTTIGKFRHLRRTSTQAGHFVIMAIDHRANLLEKLKQQADEPLTDYGFVQFKQQVISQLMDVSSAILTDPAYGLAHVVADTVNDAIGLLAPVEVTDYGLHPSQREMQMIAEWSVKKIKMMGGDGVKLLLPYHPEAENVDEKHSFVQGIIDDCTTYDIPFFLEPIPYALDPTQTLPNDELLRVSVAMCETFSAMGVDVLKLPFPVDHKQSHDVDVWREACGAVNDACTVPWALLSAGVTFDTFLKQSEVACKAGASGVIVGRAVWAEAVELHTTDRFHFLHGRARQRMQSLANVCRLHATAWHTRVDAPDTAVNWYENYQS